LQSALDRLEESRPRHGTSRGRGKTQSRSRSRSGSRSRGRRRGGSVRAQWAATQLDRDSLLRGQRPDGVTTVTAADSGAQAPQPAPTLSLGVPTPPPRSQPATPSPAPRRSATPAVGPELDGPLRPAANPGAWPTMQASSEQSTWRSRRPGADEG
jgi:hypothetical protein